MRVVTSDKGEQWADWLQPLALERLGGCRTRGPGRHRPPQERATSTWCRAVGRIGRKNKITRQAVGSSGQYRIYARISCLDVGMMQQHCDGSPGRLPASRPSPPRSAASVRRAGWLAPVRARSERSRPACPAGVQSDQLFGGLSSRARPPIFYYPTAKNPALGVIQIGLRSVGRDESPWRLVLSRIISGP